MMGRRISCVSAKLCIILCIYLSLDSFTITYRFNNTLVTDRDLYFVSQLSERVHLPSFTGRRVQQPEAKVYNGFTRRRLIINFVQNSSFALMLLILAGDIELNPGFQTIEDIKTSRGLKIGHLNIRSLRNKIDSLRLEHLDTTFDVLTLSETWLDSTIEDAEISLPGFTCVRRDRNEDKSGGGVAIYIKNCLPFRVRNDINRTDHEYVWIELMRNKCKPTLICCAYKAPNVNVKDFISSISNNSMPSIDLDKSDVVLLGDLNVNMLKNSTGCMKDKQELVKFARTFDLKQLIKEPTRIANTSRSLIDLVFVNNEHRISKSGIVPLTISDHSLVFCIIKAAGVVKAKPRIIEYRSYKNFDKNKFNKDLSDVPWHVVENENNINDAVSTWNTLFSDIANEHAPIKRQRCKGVPLPWMNSDISEAMKDRDRLHRKFLKSNHVGHWNAYKKKRNVVNRLVKTAKSKYYCDLIEDAGGDSKRIWKAVNEACARKSNSQPVQCIVADGVHHLTPKSIATTMNKFFSCIGKVLADKIVSCTSHFQYFNRRVGTHFELKEVDESTVLKQLHALKPNKAIGLDNISARLLKCSAHTIAPSITKLLNVSIRTGTVPDLWKCSKITALFKAGDRTNASNYRPISILPTLSKLLERTVHTQLYDYLNANDLLTNKQFGFRRGSSTVSALSAFADEMLLNMEQGNFCGAVFIDLTKAFDTVCHNTLLSKLSAIGVTDHALLWFQSYLGNRKQRVSCGVELSEELPVIYGVPQGSILGPLLFIVYINDLPNSLKFSYA